MPGNDVSSVVSMNVWDIPQISTTEPESIGSDLCSPRHEGMEQVQVLSLDRQGQSPPYTVTARQLATFQELRARNSRYSDRYKSTIMPTSSPYPVPSQYSLLISSVTFRPINYLEDDEPRV